MRWPAICLIVVAVFSLASAEARVDVVGVDIARWSLAVHRHVPGTADTEAQELAQWPWDRLAFTPSTTSAPGWHRLEVRVKRRGTTVKARPGYFVGAS